MVWKTPLDAWPPNTSSSSLYLVSRCFATKISHDSFYPLKMQILSNYIISSRPVYHEFSCQWTQSYTPRLYNIQLIHPKTLKLSWPQISILLQISIWFLNQFFSTMPLPKRVAIYSSRFLYLVWNCVVYGPSFWNISITYFDWSQLG